MSLECRGLWERLTDHNEQVADEHGTSGNDGGHLCDAKSVTVLARSATTGYTRTSVLESSDERASPHDHQENDAPIHSAEFVLSDSVDGGGGCVDMETPRMVLVRFGW